MAIDRLTLDIIVQTKPITDKVPKRSLEES